jgi:hypothetical protein
MADTINVQLVALRKTYERELSETQARLDALRSALKALSALEKSQKRLGNGEPRALPAHVNGGAPVGKVRVSAEVRRILRDESSLTTAQIAERIDPNSVVIPPTKTLTRAVAGVIFSMKTKAKPEVTEREGRYTLATR